MKMKELITPLASFFKVDVDHSLFSAVEWEQVLRDMEKDPVLLSHSKKVTYYSMLMFDGLSGVCEMSDTDRKTLFLSAFLHDIGKLRVSYHILNKVSPLTKEEFEHIKCHPVFGFEFISKYENLKNIIDNILHHHERFDGRGYPHGLCGNNIPMLARIISVADSFDAMTSLRPYKKTFSMDYALGEILENAGCQFDPSIAECFINLCKSNKVVLGWDC